MDGETLRAVAAVHPEAFARALADAVRGFTRRNPAPRALPFFGFDHPEGCGSRLLDRLSDLGIFRFYERVLDLGPGLGGPARWLARRRGCRVVSVSDEVHPLRAAAWLNRRAHLEAQVVVARTRTNALPFPAGTFTHAWSVERLHRHADKGAVLREVFRAVRPGGQVAIQDWMVCDADARGLPGRFEPLDAFLAGLLRAGFVEVRGGFVDDLREGDDALGEILAERLARALAGSLETADVVAERERRRETAEARRLGRLRLAQVFAARPS